MSESAKLVIPLTDVDHVWGDTDADHVLVEYGDYQCEHCQAFHRELKQLQQSDLKFRFCFRHLPMRHQHPMAQLAAQAAEAAGAQDKFWGMHDLLFTRASKLDHDLVYVWAEELGLDLVQFKTDLRSSKVNNKISADFEGGIKSGVNGTPSLFLNGYRYDGNKTARALNEKMQQTSPTPV